MTVSQVTTTAEFADRVFGSVLGALDTFANYVGDKLGLYRALADSGPMTESELASATAMNVRYAREWLEHQVTAGVLEVDGDRSDPSTRMYVLPPAQAEVLGDADSLSYLAPLARLVMAGAIQLPSLIDAYRTGGGVSWRQFGPDMRTGQADMNRPWFLTELGPGWFASVPHLHGPLSEGATVADVGCGEGWSSIGLAQAYPKVTVHGFDIDQPSVEAARRHAEAAGVGDRVMFHEADAGGAMEGSYDLVTASECIHDLPDPVAVLSKMRQACAPDGHVVVMDEAVADEFGDKNDETERLMYGFSLFVCLPDGLSHQPSAGTGTVMRKAALERYARQAGFSGVDVLAIENDLWRFYELR